MPRAFENPFSRLKMAYSGDFDHLLASSPVPGASFETDHDIDEMVKRNIQDVLLAAEQDNMHSGAFMTENEPSTSAALRRGQQQPGSSTQRQESLEGGRTSKGRASSGGMAVPATPGGAAVDFSSSNALDVPGHAEATLRLHKARIKGLEDDSGKLALALADRDKQLVEVKRDNKALKMEQAAWGKTQKALEAQVEKLKRTAQEAEAALAAREAALKEIGKEGGRAEKERRAGEQEARARDVRLQRALEEVEKYKQMLQDARTGEKEGKDVVRGEHAKVLAENKKLERQRAELLVAFKKQLRLIDVLKRQKLHLEAARALQFTEQEFLQALEMGHS